MIKTVQNITELKIVFNFLSALFYEEALQHHQRYHPIGQRHEEMKAQFEMNSELLMYPEKDGHILAAVTGKSLDLKRKQVTLGILGVAKDARSRGYGRFLIEEFVKRGD